MSPLLMVWMLGCGSPEAPVVEAPPEVVLPDGGLTEGEAAVTPEGQTGRDRRRMTVPQLADSIEVATGLRWMDGNDDRFEEFEATLGVPDWFERTTENLNPDLVFNKLLEDAATEVCESLVAEEASGGDRLLVGVDLSMTVDTHRTEIESALSSALLRFHGHDVPVGDDRLGGWVWLFESSTNVTDGDTEIAWRAVCTALIVHPDFYTY